MSVVMYQTLSRTRQSLVRSLLPRFGGRIRFFQGNKRAQTRIAQEKTAPNQHTEQDLGNDGLADAQLSENCSAQIAGQQDRSEKGSLRDYIEKGAPEFEGTD